MSLRNSGYFTAGALGAGVVIVMWYFFRKIQSATMEMKPTTRIQAPGDMGMHQRAVLQHVVPPAAINVNWDDVAGLEKLLTLIRRQVIYPMRTTLTTQDPLTLPPKGVLLHGPPGCGKTMVAKAIAKDINAVFINFDVSSIKNKFVGETEKMTAALFSTANRLQPAVIFVDEADAFLSTRRETDFGTENTMKAQFLTLWDGLTTNPNARVLVLAATNRREAIDPAILRRLPVQFEFPFPDREQRVQILSVTLRHSHLASDVNLEMVADRCEGFSGSDLYELCRYAAITRLVRQAETCSCSSSCSTCSISGRGSLKEITMADFLDALNNARDLGTDKRPPSHLYM